MKKNWKSTFGLAAIIAVIVGAVAWGLWQMQGGESTQVQNCAQIADHMERFDCYGSDESAQTLWTAVENNQPELCQDVEHIFIPHDVLADIRNGIIGTLIEGDEAVIQCEQYVERGTFSMGG